MPFTIPTQAPITSQGGHVVPTGVANATAYPCAEWRIQRNAKLADSTVSSSGGENRVSVLRGGTVQVNVPWNNTNGQTPENVGFLEGSQMLCGFIIGGSSPSLWYTFNIIIERIEVICNAANDIVRLTISGYAQGAIPLPTSTPA